MNSKKINGLFLKFIKLIPLGTVLGILNRKKKESLPPQSSPSQIKKILFIKLEGMGDSVYMLEIIQRLLKNYPLLKIDVLTTGGNPLFPLFKSSLNEPYKLRYDVKILKPLSPASYYKTVKDINKENYGMIFDFTGMPVNIPLMLLFVQSYKAGFDMLDLRKKSYGYMTRIDNEIHIFDNYLNLVKQFFSISEEKKFTINFNIQSPENNFKNGGGNFINLVLSSSGGGNMNRRLPSGKSALLINLLLKNFPGYKINLLGGPTDYPYLEDLCGGLTADIVSVKKTKNIQEAAELLKNSYFNICIDSGLMHISSLVNPNTYCLFGYSSPLNSLPFNNIGYYAANIDCAPCSFYKISECKTLEC
ncbi:MAG: hypothetical protein M1276_07080, partial [Deltaproteobacteria bacterium]|nr:hypothetical protein [Deltaproteobacteria bacterium]